MRIDGHAQGREEHGEEEVAGGGEQRAELHVKGRRPEQQAREEGTQLIAEAQELRHDRKADGRGEPQREQNLIAAEHGSPLENAGQQPAAHHGQERQAGQAHRGVGEHAAQAQGLARIGGSFGLIH